jgi:hypothetical protein
MSRTLASMLILVGCLGAANALPPPRVDEIQDRQQEIANEREHRVIQARIIAHMLGLRPEPTEEQIDRRLRKERQKLELQLETRISEIDGACSLGDQQKRKLQLAGQSEIKGFLGFYEQALGRLRVIEREEDLDKMSDEAEHLQITLEGGLFHEDSLLVKSLRNTLTGEQLARYEAMAGTSRELRHRQNVLKAVATLKRVFDTTLTLRKMHGKLNCGIILREDQQEVLITLMTHETKSSQRPSRWDSQVLLLQLSRLPEEKLKHLFDDDQWEIIKSTFPAWQCGESMFKREGLLPAEGNGTESIHHEREP